MSILNVTSYPAGLVDVNPSVVYIDTNDTLSTIISTGYLNSAVQQGFVFNVSMMACVRIHPASGDDQTTVNWFNITKSGQDWSLVANNNSILLPSGQILIGNTQGIAQARTMSGDVTITSNTGTSAIATGAVTTTKIGSGAVTLAKLATGITPQSIINFSGQVTTIGGAASENFTITGVTSSFFVFLNMVTNGPNDVTIKRAVLSTNILTIIFTADPGANTLVNYIITKVAS